MNLMPIHLLILDTDMLRNQLVYLASQEHMSLMNCLVEGYNDERLGKSTDDNPYQLLSPEYCNYLDGWLNAYYVSITDGLIQA